MGKFNQSALPGKVGNVKPPSHTRTFHYFRTPRVGAAKKFADGLSTLASGATSMMRPYPPASTGGAKKKLVSSLAHD